MLSVDIARRAGPFTLKAAFETPSGVTGILGASGSGKSMMLRCIAGVEKPDEGRIVLDGVTLFDSAKGIDMRPQQRRVGCLFQHYALFPHMTVEKNVLCGLFREKDRSAKKRAAREAIELLDLNGLEGRLPGELSGGQQQRAALARMLVSRPRLLMLDEPFSSLDEHLRARLRFDLKRLLQQYGEQALLVTHDRDDACCLCERIVVLHDGRSLPLKSTQALFDDPGSIAAAEISGCKNITAAVKTGENELLAPAWGVRLITARPLREGLCAVGLRAHYFDPRLEVNRFPVVFTDSVDAPFDCVFRFRYEAQGRDSPALWWQFPRPPACEELPRALGIAPHCVLPLYRE